MKGILLNPGLAAVFIFGTTMIAFLGMYSIFDSYKLARG